MTFTPIKANMSFAATFDTFANVRNVTPGARLVLAAISTFTNKQGTCFPSLKAIAERTSLTVRSVQRHLASLISLGYIERIYRTGRSALTRINLARLSPATTTGGGDKNDTTGGDKNDVQNLPVQPTTIRAVHEPATPEPQHQQATAPVAAMPPSLFSDIEQPEQPHPAIPDIEQPANTTTEAPKTPVEPSNEADPTNPPTDTPTPAVADPVEEAVKALASLPKALLDDMAMIRVSKKRPARVTRTEAQILTDEAKKAGWSLEQVIVTMICHGWARFQADWVQHVPPQTAPAAPKVWTPDQNHTPASPSTIAQMKEKIAKMKERWAAEKTAPPPMRQ